MFEIEICEPRRVLLIRFGQEVEERDFPELDAITEELRKRGLYDSIVVMPRVDLDRFRTPDSAPGFVASRGAVREPFAGKERIYVAPHDDLKLLVRLFAGYQESHGLRRPSLVDTLDEAFQQLNVTAADFRPFQRPEPHG